MREVYLEMVVIVTHHMMTSSVAASSRQDDKRGLGLEAAPSTAPPTCGSAEGGAVEGVLSGGADKPHSQ